MAGIRETALAGRPPLTEPRMVIGESWRRMIAKQIDPETGNFKDVLSPEEVERRRQASPLAEVMPVLTEGLVSVADVASHIMIVADPDGRVLWREGNVGVLKSADRLGFAVGASWAEDVMGTNGIGTALVAGRPVQVWHAEHFVRSLHPWTCAGAPIRDPRDGRLLGVVDLSGPAATMHPATLALVTSVTRLAEAELHTRHLLEIERLRSVAAPVLCRITGRAFVVDANGWMAAVTGMPPFDRLPLPRSLRAGRHWLPSFGMCAVEPLPGGWLVKVGDEHADGTRADTPNRVVLDLSRPRRWSVTVSGAAGSWSQELSPRHAELLFALARSPGGRTAAELARDIFGDPTRTVTVRAEMSRIRRTLAGVLAHRPYRFSEEVEVEILPPSDPADLLPHSAAPVVGAARRSSPSGIGGVG
ncbi:helix-turn-helix domain-containing protein [Streptomyces sp. GC420]|uniref:helix-turn-helix domain-containing protein n=1 Tax=Streptomyces sp. GC420 TaxID=2697568 RepID=UPI001FB5C277|nr:helix-turn-helix domain-containing protein [Streptomyces sp. GC420]